MGMKARLRRIVEGTDTATGRLFDWAVMALIVYSIITLTIETLPDLSAESRRFLWYSEVLVTIAFTCEYLLRIWVAERKAGYVFSFNGLVDLLAILPFYLTLALNMAGVDLRAVRAFRLLRLLRLFKLARYNRALGRLGRAFWIAREEMILYLFLTVILLYLSAVGIYYFEHPAQPETFKSIAHSLWWALITLTTVGYGDIYPVTLGGRIFTFFVLMTGLGIVAIPAGLIASAMSQVRREEREEIEAGGRDGEIQSDHQA